MRSGRFGASTREMPVVFENQQWAIPNTLTNFRPLPFRDVIYSIHFYYPYEVAFQGLNGSPTGIEYPGKINGEMWDRARLEKELLPVIDLQKKHDVRIFIGEFSCIRWRRRGRPPVAGGYDLDFRGAEMGVDLSCVPGMERLERRTLAQPR